MGSVGVLTGEAETDTYLKREAELGAAGGVALPPQPIGALPAAHLRTRGERQGPVPPHHSAA